MVSLLTEMRGAATASNMLMPWSTTLLMPWAMAGTMAVPPGAPTTMKGFSSRKTMVGLWEEVRLLPGAMECGRPGRGSKPLIKPLYMKPSPSVMTPEGVFSVCVSETALPSASTTLTWVVSADS